MSDLTTSQLPAKSSSLPKIARIALTAVLGLAILGELLNTGSFVYLLTSKLYEPNAGDWASLAVGLVGAVLMGLAILLSRKSLLLGVGLGLLGSVVATIFAQAVWGLALDYFSMELVTDQLPFFSLVNSIEWADEYLSSLPPVYVVNYLGWGILTPIAQILIIPVGILALISGGKAKTIESSSNVPSI